ncbi:MAG: hypothetical protein CMB48_06205 [Euryarchaeota archaeon]|nr:hypothetical protein [Euryarchaeota archaeon]|tara:strand:+ start:7886 stop:8533 length:648 start_codon:yes stop_codon:yes gene_type:complete
MDEQSSSVSAIENSSEINNSSESGGIDPWQLADAILERMDVTDSQTIDEMIHKRAVFSGTIIGGLLLFWWLVFVKFDSASFNEPELILQLNYEVISALLPFLVFAGSVLNMMSRELGRPGPGTIAGFLLLISVYFVIEPLGMFLFNQTDAEIGTVVWLCSRLAIIGSGVYIGSKMLMEAFLLSWVKRFLEMHEASITKEDSITPVEMEAAEIAET